jgi:hypothetical protein
MLGVELGETVGFASMPRKYATSGHYATSANSPVKNAVSVT